jgi:hypothetical protein
MTSSSFSPIEDLNAAIQSYNPFNRPAAVKQQDIWGKGFPDVTTLNAHASDAIFQALKQVSSGQGKVTSIAITAEQGVGKTHTVSRIRHRLQSEGGALFVYVSGSKFINLNRIQYQFLQILGDSLNQIGSQGVKQWQELAVAILNQIGEESLPLKEVIENFPFILESYGMDRLVKEVCKIKTHINDPYVVRAILWTLSEDYELDAIRWLSGNDISEAKTTKLELPNPDQEQREARAFDTVLQILSLISDHSALIICFDELEGLEINDNGYTKAQVIASELVKNLFDSVNVDSVSQGIVILTVMILDTWVRKIKPLPGGIPYKVSTATIEPIELRYMNGDSIVELVTLWMKEFYEARNLVPHNPVYPFNESQLRGLATEKPTVRRILQWCAGHFEDSGTYPGDQKELQPVEAAFNKELADIEASIETWIENKETIAAALWLGFYSVIGQAIDAVTIERIEEVEPKRENKGYIDFKIVTKENGKTVRIGVAVLQQSSGNGVLAGLQRLVEYKKFGLNRGCLVRSKEISPNATQSQECLNQLLKKRGEWVKLTGEDIKPLLAIHSVYHNLEDYELSEEQIFDFIDQRNLAVDNYLIREILSDPSGQVPSGLVEE